MKNQVVNHYFTSTYLISKKGYFFLGNTEDVEMIDGKLNSKSDVIWKNCNELFLIVKESSFNGPIQVGDTIKIQLLSLNHDTLTYISSWKKLSYTFKGLKIK